MWTYIVRKKLKPKNFPTMKGFYESISFIVGHNFNIDILRYEG